MIKRFFRWLRGLFRLEEKPVIERQNCLDCRYGNLDPWVWPCRPCLLDCCRNEKFFSRWTPKNRHFTPKEG